MGSMGGTVFVAMKKQRTGLMLVLVAVGAASVGFLLGWQMASDAPAERGHHAQRSAQSTPDDWEGVDPWDREEPEPIPVPVATAAERESKKEYLKPSELIDSLRENANSPRAQKMLLGMVADAALAGGRMIPEITRMLNEGTDITFTSYKPGEPGYPSLRVALLAAAEATGDPAAVKLIAEVAATSESPVEVVFLSL